MRSLFAEKIALRKIACNLELQLRELASVTSETGI